MTDARLPMTVIGGYLGAGKTTLINGLLQAPHGLRLMVMVNDFGAINIDADLLESAEEDTLALTNGCVCCTMGADLFLAVGKVLDRAPRPDHLMIEASGIADPQKIANGALAEPDMRYGGIISVADALNFANLVDDPLIGPQVRDQIACADLIALSKTRTPDPAMLDRLREINPTPPITADGLESLDIPLLMIDGPTALKNGRDHPAYTSWSHEGAERFDARDLTSLLEKRPEGLIRVKGQVKGTGDHGWTVQVVGRQIDLSPVPQPETGRLVCIGPKERLRPGEVDRWWRSGAPGANDRR